MRPVPRATSPSASSPRRPALRTLPVLVFAAAAVGWGEWVHWRASHRALGAEPGPGPREVVVVLGFKNRGRRINAMNRWRARAGLRTRRRDDTLLVLCGGPMGSDVPEAELLRAYLTDRLAYSGPVALDATSRTTSENIRHAIPHLEGADRIAIVSNPVHAELGRRYLARERPDLARRLVRGRDYRLGEHAWAKPVLAAVALRVLADRFPAPGVPFELRLSFPLPRAVVWDRLWDPARHARSIPLTRVEPARGTLARTGHRFTARTGVGPLGVDDVMEVREAATPPDGPWTCRVEKVGRIVGGSIVATATQPRAGATELTWRQNIRLSALPDAFDPVVAVVARRAYAVTIRRIVGT